MGQMDNPITKNQLGQSVLLAKNLKLKHKFSNKKPSKRWFQSFFKRHPDISVRISQNLCRSRSSITEQGIRNWFKNLKDYSININNLEILNNPSRIFNCNETAFFLNPKNKNVIVKKGSKKVFNRIKGNKKECLVF